MGPAQGQLQLLLALGELGVTTAAIGLQRSVQLSAA
jgi:hypothetical protein